MIKISVLCKPSGIPISNMKSKEQGDGDAKRDSFGDGSHSQSHRDQNHVEPSLRKLLHLRIVLCSEDGVARRRLAGKIESYNLYNYHLI